MKPKQIKSQPLPVLALELKPVQSEEPIEQKIEFFEKCNVEEFLKNNVQRNEKNEADKSF